MGNEIRIFNNAEFGSVRTVMINDEPWFIGKDVAVALGYKETAKAVREKVDEEDKGVSEMDTPGGKQKVMFVNESGLYTLVLSSKLPTAKKFKKWITSEVLPSIRKNGGYMAGQENMTEEEVVANALIVAQNIITARNKRIKLLETKNRQLVEKNEEMSGKAMYFDALVDKNLLTNFTTTAKELGIKPKQLITYLLDHKYIYRKSNGTLLPYQNRNNGLFEIKETLNHKTGWTGIQTLVTPKGRQTFQMLLSVPGALATVTTIADEDQPA